MKRVFLCLMALLLLVTSVPYTPVTKMVSSAVGSESGSVVVTASESDMTVKINAVGTSGKADFIRMNANEYYNGDTLRGLSSLVSSGVVVGTYTCGTNSEITFPRYTKDLQDNIYSKYYVVQSGAILYGPVYTTDIAAPVESVYQKTENKKGLYVNGNTSYLSELQELGCSNTTIEFDISQFILPNEDRSGNTIDQSNNSNAVYYVSNGKTYYFNRSYIETFDDTISTFSKAGVNINLVVIATKVSDFTKYPVSLVYTTGNVGSQMAFNSSNEKGAGYWIAAMEFLADRYSRAKETGLVKNFIIGNEIDYAYAYYTIQSTINNKGKTSLDVFMEEYSRTLRLANLAVKKYCKDMTVTVPLTNNWATSGYDNSDKNTGYEYLYNSYAPKEIIDWLAEKTAMRGNYDWAIAPHCYFSSRSDSRASAMETGVVSGLKNLISNDYNTAKVISYSNLELLQQYLELEANKYDGQVRDIHLTGAGVSSYLAESNSNKNNDYERQAAYLAFAYYKASLLDSVKSFSYYRYMDNYDEAASSACFGLVTKSRVKKPSYEVYKNIDTEKSFETAEKYLSYISFKKDGTVYSKDNGNISSYKDTMEMVKTSYDWNKLWDDSKIISSQASSTSLISLSLDKYVFVPGEDIKVTATGSDSAWVGIYKSDDNVQGGTEAIYWYYVDKENGGKTHFSGNTYTIQTDGELNSSRADLKDLPAGEYKIVLFKDKSYAVADTVDITVNTANTPYVKTNKTEYTYGEDILVSAADPAGSNTWAGIYKKGDKVGDVNSIYWYYTDNSGSAVVIQNQNYNSDSSNGPDIILGAGNYEVYLFKETDTDSYIKLAQTNITVNSPSKPTAFKYISYSLDNETDGFANGTVTVTLPGETGATDCVLFWADDNGPLSGYSSLAMFKLTGRVTQYRFPSHTIIPEGATRLIAYSAYGESNFSDTYAETKLPAGCTYKIGDDYLSEFQVVSDIHINSQGHIHNNNFKLFLEDVVKNSPDSTGIFVVGDIADNGLDSQYKNLESICDSVEGEPTLHLAMGNHDWYNDNPNKQFEKYISKFNPNANNNGKIYYDEVVDGNYYIYLGSEKRGNGLHAYLSNTQLEWLKGKLEAYTEKEPNKPIFLFLHQSFYNTIAGSLPGEGWHGIDNEEALANVIKDYNNIIMFSGHSHWVLDSKSNMFVGTTSRPTALNTASVAYLWSGYNIVSGEYADGSEGYFVRTYDDKVIAMGRDFINGVYNPSAIYVIEQNKISTSQSKYTVSADSDVFNLEASVLDKSSRITYKSSDENVAIVDALGNVSAKNVGTAEIELFANSTNTKTIAKGKVTVEVTNSFQEIIANSFVKTYGDADFAISARYNGNPVVTYTSDNEKVATVSNEGIVSIKGTGSANITIKTSAVDEYSAAEKTITVIVVKANQEFSLSETIEKPYTKTPFSLGNVLSKGDGALTFTSDNPKVVEISSAGVITIKGIGTAKITIVAAASDNYKRTSTTVSLVVTKNSQIINVSDIVKTADTDTFNLGATLEAGDGKLTYSSSDKNVATVSSTGVVTIKKAGVTNITVKAAATSIFNENSKTVKLTVNKANQTITASDITKYVSSAPFNIGAKLKKGNGKLSYFSSDKNIAEISDDGVVTIKKQGKVDITITASATDRYNSATKTIALTILKGNQVITLKDMVKDANVGTFKLGNILTTGDGKLTYSSSDGTVATVSSAGVVTVKKAGVTKITVKASATTKFNAAEKTVTLTVNKAKQVIKASNITKNILSDSFKIGAVLTKGDGKLTYKSSNTKVVTVSSKGVITVKGVGYAYITVTASETNKYQKATKKVLIKINPKSVTVKSLKKTSNTSAKLTWKADKKVTGYIIEYSTSKKFTEKTTKKIIVSGSNKTAKTITGLKKGKKYYVRIRSYKKGNVKVYSSYKLISIKM